MTRAATYVRLSASGEGEDAGGLIRQREAVERYIQGQAWALADRHRFRDADISAFSGTARPGFEALKEAVRAREVDAVVVWKLDRAFRSIPDAAAFLQVCREVEVTFVSSSEGIDTSTPFGPVMFNIVAAMAELESRTKSDRIAAWHQQRAERGLPSGGGSRPFGFERDRITHRPEEAEAIRQAVKALLAEETTLRGIVADWQERFPTPTGGRWTKTTVKRLLLSPRIAGLRQHDPNRDGSGTTYPAEWEGIIAEDEHLLLRQRYEGREPPPPGRRYLLTGGLATCGVCGRPLVARPRGDGARSYVCPPEKDGGCGKIRALAEPFENHVRELTAAEWDRRQRDAARRGMDWPPTAEPVEDEEALRREIDADEDALRELARDRYVRRVISATEFEAAREDLTRSIAEAQRRLAAAAEARQQVPWTAIADELEAYLADPEAAEENFLRSAELRSWIQLLVEHVKVEPAVRGRNRFDPDRFSIVWQDDVRSLAQAEAG